MSSVFPDVERFFIESVRNFEKEISDPQLRKAIKAFIGQEAHHGHEQRPGGKQGPGETENRPGSGTEATEHKAVAYDVYEAIGGAYLTRSTIMLGVTLVLINKIIVIQNQFLANWKVLGNGKSWLATIKFFWGLPGFLRRTLPSYLRYFKPGFHPRREDNRDLLKNWQEKIESSVNETERNFTIQKTGNAKTATV